MHPSLPVARLLVAIAAATSVTLSAAASWPERPVRVVVPAPAGSSLDIVARALADALSPVWRQSILVENKPGAGGLIGVEAAAKAAPDGLVLALGFNGPLAYAPFLYARMPYDARKDLAPVVLASSQPNVLAVPASLPVRSVADLVAWARVQGGKVSYASVGSGSASHLAMALFLQRARVDATHVPFNGSPAAALSIARGDTQMLFAVASGVMPQVQTARIRLLAVTSARRFPGLEALPTLAESGFPGFEAEAWNGLVAAAGTPRALVARINADVNAALHRPDVAGRLRNLGMAAAGGTPDDFAALIDAEMRRWGPVIRRAGVRIE
jgi:tripartite-type tricarboxylate transporter receptor subunit TctC